jgi:hypothetical protein
LIKERNFETINQNRQLDFKNVIIGLTIYAPQHKMQSSSQANDEVIPNLRNMLQLNGRTSMPYSSIIQYFATKKSEAIQNPRNMSQLNHIIHLRSLQ